MERLEFMVDDQLRAEGAIAKFRAGQISIGLIFLPKPGAVAVKSLPRHLRRIDRRGGKAYFSAQFQIRLPGHVELSTRRQKYVEDYVGVNFTSILVFV